MGWHLASLPHQGLGQVASSWAALNILKHWQLASLSRWLTVVACLRSPRWVCSRSILLPPHAYLHSCPSPPIPISTPALYTCPHLHTCPLHMSPPPHLPLLVAFLSTDLIPYQVRPGWSSTCRLTISKTYFSVSFSGKWGLCAWQAAHHANPGLPLFLLLDLPGTPELSSPPASLSGRSQWDLLLALRTSLSLA